MKLKFRGKSKSALFAFIAGLTVLFSSCSKEDTGNGGAGDYVLSLALQGSDGNFTYYPVQFEDVMSGKLSALGQGMAMPGYYTYRQIGSKIYAAGGLGNNDLYSISKDGNGNLVKTGGNVVFTNGLSEILKIDSNTLLAIEMSTSSDMLNLHTINASNLSILKTVKTPVSEISSVSAPAFSGAVLTDKYLYISFYISNPTTWATDYTDQAQVAVFSYPELTLKTVISDPITGPIGGFGTNSGLIKDEKGDVYALSHSNPANGFSQTTKKGAIVRIKSGEVAFDKNYYFDIEAATQGLNTAHMIYLGNGKVFSEINTQKNSEQTRWSDGPLKPAIIDIYNKTVHFIDGVPAHSGIGRKLENTALVEGKYVYLCVPEASTISVYQIDTESYTSKKGATVESNFVAGFFKL